MANLSSNNIVSSSIPLSIFIIGFIVQHGIYRGIGAMFKRMDKGVHLTHQRREEEEIISSSNSFSFFQTYIHSLRNLDPYARRRFGLYILSTIHSLIVSLYSINLIITNGPLTISTAAKQLNSIFMHPDSLEVYHDPLPHCANYASAVMLLAYSLSYFVHDSLITLPEWLSHPSDALHHIFGIILVITCILIPIPARLSHHLLITELSTPFLNIMWINKKLKYEEGWFMRICLVCFVTTFFLTRIIYVPVVLYTVLTKLVSSVAYYYPQVPTVMTALTLLNYFWFYKILGMLYRQWFNSTNGELIPNRSSTEETNNNRTSGIHNDGKSTSTKGNGIVEHRENKANEIVSSTGSSSSNTRSHHSCTTSLSKGMNALAAGIVGGDIATSIDRYINPNMTLPKKDDDEDTGKYSIARVGMNGIYSNGPSSTLLRYRPLPLREYTENDNKQITSSASSTFPSLTTNIQDEPVALSSNQGSLPSIPSTTTLVTNQTYTHNNSNTLFSPSARYITAMGSPLRYFRGTPTGNDEQRTD